ncbi:hypothetical protein CEXT_711381 [Caerostris extrusa]|uniref:Uncharacterized protein n=1 Tax=Caerostris extrusa TaxID=172846 RepID=A0AAV4Y2X0_CAEEX|nr:hypothetical protein CEXT_711381 [Caerostris extrusa]
MCFCRGLDSIRPVLSGFPDRHHCACRIPSQGLLDRLIRTPLWTVETMPVDTPLLRRRHLQQATGLPCSIFNTVSNSYSPIFRSSSTDSIALL